METKRNVEEAPEGQDFSKRIKTEQEEIVDASTAPPPSSSSSSSSSFTEVEAVVAVSPSPVERASWFDKDTIHANEMEYCSEYFQNKRANQTPTIYKKIRDEIIDFYEKDPKKFLTLTTLRQNMLGDVCSIMKIYDFLNAHLIINYDVAQSPYVKTSVINDVLPFTMYENIEEAEKAIQAIRDKKDKESSIIEGIYELYDRDGNSKAALEEIKKAARAKIEDLKVDLGKQLEEYMEVRYKMLQQKLRLLDHVERGYAMEQEEIEATRRDNQISRAYISYVNYNTQ